LDRFERGEISGLVSARLEELKNSLISYIEDFD
jgi:hypothetical protein